MESLPGRAVGTLGGSPLDRISRDYASRTVRAARRFMFSFLMAATALHASAAPPQDPVQPAAAAGAGGTDADTGPVQPGRVNQGKGGDAGPEAPKNSSAPTPEECKQVYPAGVQVMSVRRIEYRDIAPAQAARASFDATGQDGKEPGSVPGALSQKSQAVRSGTGDGAGSSLKSEVAELRHGLTVEVAHLPALIRLQECPGKKRELVLFLAGRPLPGLTAYPPTDPQHNNIVFLLERTENNHEAWTHLLGRPTIRPVTVNVSIGFDDSYAIPSSVKMQFRAIPIGWSITWLGLMVVFALLILWAGRNSGMLRDSGVVTVGHRAMFSLARVQLTYWTFIVLGSFVFIGMITGDYLNSMNEKVLALMGISVGTSLGSSIIDNGASGTSPRAALSSTGSWWRDILNDGKDISIHRFQMTAWTIVLGIVFLHQVYSKLAMPELPLALLGLMGISAGTYLGLKVTAETPQASVAAAGAGREVQDPPRGRHEVLPQRGEASGAAVPEAGPHNVEHAHPIG